VAGEYQSTAPFFAHNRALIHDVEELEHKARRRDILVDEQTLYEFYDERVPADVCDGRRFEQWRKEAEREDPQRLFVTKDYLMRRRPAEVTEEQFPDHLTLSGMRLPLSYHFEPGHPLDGVTVTVPLAMLNQVTPQSLEWLVPGLLRDKIIALLKTLPKTLRRNFVPAPDFADACLQAMLSNSSHQPPLSPRERARGEGIYSQPPKPKITNPYSATARSTTLTKRQALVLARGRHSSIITLSPCLHSFFSS
jgi:ATP-dependent helicase HrpA